MDDAFVVLELIVDERGRVVDARKRDANPAYERHVGRPFVAGALVSALAPGLEDHWLAHFERTWRSGTPSRVVERAESLGRWYEASLSRVGAPDERQVACVFRDVTEREQVKLERERAEQRLHELATALAESDRRKTEFLAILAHELRNPLAPVRNGLELIDQLPPGSEESGRVRRMMARQVDHMVHLVDDLLDIARISQGAIELKLERTPLSDVVEGVIEANRALIEGRRHALETMLPERPVTLVADPVRLAQIISNLLVNAARYTAEGGHIRLATRLDGDVVEVSVEDDGEGIDARAIDRVFEMFTQITGETPREHGGLGLGLTLARRLATLHGGTLVGRSDGLGQGSRFVLRLPANRPVSPPDDRPIRDAASRGPGERTRRILVVDDNRDAADALARLLALRGFETSVAYDGRSALERVRNDPPDVAFLDIGLPDITGYQIATELADHDARADMTLVALTGWGTREDRARGDAAGFDHHLTKPVSSKRVLGVLAEIEDAALEEH